MASFRGEEFWVWWCVDRVACGCHLGEGAYASVSVCVYLCVPSCAGVYVRVLCLRVYQ